jgi:Trk K+ transport system NAD-binding subunit
MEAVIYGCGRLTSMMAPHLAQSGYQVAVLDSDPFCLESVVKEPQIRGVLINEPVMQDYLQQGSIGISEVFLALSGDDHKNALVAQMARHIFNIRTVICLLGNPQLQQLYSGLGLKIVGTSVLDLFEDIRQAMEGQAG